MPRKPKATRPNAKTAGAAINASRPSVLKINAMAIKPTMLMPSQNAEKFPATKPDRMFSDGPPSREDVTTSCTCRDPVEVKILTSSGITAPAKVPQEMIIARSEEHTSELQSLAYLVCRLLLEKKNIVHHCQS